MYLARGGGGGGDQKRIRKMSLRDQITFSFSDFGD